jgi:hypothetical protein
MVLGGSARSSINNYKTYIDVALFSELRLKPLDRFHIQNYHFCRIDREPERKGGTAVAVRKDTLTCM